MRILAPLFILFMAGSALAQSAQPVVPIDGGLPVSSSNPLHVTGSSTITGTTSNASSGVATSSTNVPTVSYNYVFNGTTWDQETSLSVGSKHAPTVAIVDASGNQITTFGGAASTSNATSGVATSSTNQASVVWNYGFNGTTWDQLQVDASKFLKVGPQYSGDIIINPSNNFTRPANTTAYASGQLVANSVTAGSVVPLTWTASRVATGNFRISRVRMTLSSKSVTNTNFRIHFFNLTTGVSNGDGGTFVPSLAADEVCEMDVTIALAGADVSVGYGAANQGVACDVALGSGSSLFALVEARAAYTPASGEVITVVPEIHQN